MRKITFDKIWEARKQGYSDEDAKRGFIVNEVGAIHRIECMNIFDTNLEAAAYAKNHCNMKLINIAEDYPFVQFDYELMKLGYVGCKKSRKMLSNVNEYYKELFSNAIESYNNYE